MPTRQAGLISGALDAVVAVVEGEGIAASRDPSDFQPPAVIVGPPTVTGLATLGSIGLTVPVYIVHPDPGIVGLEWMLEQVEILLPAFGETASEPTLWNSPLNPAGLPAYLITVRLNVST